MKILETQNAQLHHLKPHGALYNEVAKNSKIAEVIVIYKELHLNISILAPFKSMLANQAMDEDIPVIFEALGIETISLIYPSNHVLMRMP